MKVRELIAALETCDPDAPLRLYGKTETDRCARVVALDGDGPYRGVFVVSDEDEALANS